MMEMHNEPVWAMEMNIELGTSPCHWKYKEGMGHAAKKHHFRWIAFCRAEHFTTYLPAPPARNNDVSGLAPME